MYNNVTCYNASIRDEYLIVVLLKKECIISMLFPSPLKQSLSLIDNNGFDKNVTYTNPGHIIIAFTNKTDE